MQTTDIADDTQDQEAQTDGAAAETPAGPEKGGQSASSRAPGRTSGKQGTAKDAPAPDEQGGQEDNLPIKRRAVKHQSAEWALIEMLGALRAAEPDNFPDIFPAGPSGEESADEEPSAGTGADNRRQDACTTNAGPADAAPAAESTASAAKIAANRANALKSTGPVTAEGKRRSRMNGLKSYSGRLYGAVQSRTLRLDAGGAERIYQELVRPYERPGRPAPPMLAIHFHDLARLRLELESWERIRDAELAEGWRQNQIERRQRLHDLLKDIPASNEEMLEKGLAGLPESPVRAKKLVECLSMLGGALDRRDFDLGPVLRTIYGKELYPASDRALIVCVQCQRLMNQKRKPLAGFEFEQLRHLVELEQQDALAAYGLYVDHATLPEAACVARLRQTAGDRAMTLQGERLRQAIDRKQRVIISLLRVLGLNRNEDEDDYEDAEGVERQRALPTAVKPRNRAKNEEKKILKFCKAKPTSRLASTKGSPKPPKAKPKNRLPAPHKTA